VTSSSKPEAPRSHIPAAASSVNSVEFQGAVAAALGERLADIDLVRAVRHYGSVGAIAKGMTNTLPDVIVSEPLIGPCYSTLALSQWKQISRQAVDQQRRSRRLFGAMIDGRWLYPAVQFDSRGRQSQAFAALLLIHSAGAGKEVEFAVWLETPDPKTGISPRAELQNAPDLRTLEERFFDGFVPTIIEPPLRKTGALS
jgi:hypothetical protein